MELTNFKKLAFLDAIKTLFRDLNVPINYVDDKPVDIRYILKDTYKNNSAFQLVQDVYFVGMVDDAAFDKNESLAVDKIKSDYDGILIFGIELGRRENNLLPTRSQLAEISQAFNREFYYTPVVVVFKYSDDSSDYLSFANTERLKYKQEWREGEKAGKVSILRDININDIHRGHKDIINGLKINNSGLKIVDSFEKLYNHWRKVFSVSILNKKFYNELQNWYYWAVQEVSFPNAPNRFDFELEEKYIEAVNEHKGKNVIRLLTRLLFVWFVKEKGLIPEELFNEKFIVDKLIKEFTPQKPHGLFATGKNNSQYYRAILQNLFFATLNREMGKRGFRTDGKDMNATTLMRYRNYFKDSECFVSLMEDVVPFMNGGLFECLDRPHPTAKGKRGGDLIIYNDGFSDRIDNELIVPDYLFFDVDEDIDISNEIGNKAKVYKNAKTRGLLEILTSYKFTISENTPLEEDVALDPELLGKVFENLLASYNPETKTTARKQTGSFYTPRRIVDYMVDESLIAYLKKELKSYNQSDNKLDEDLHGLLSYDKINPFEGKRVIEQQIIIALDKCKILDPACGSGAFPMGILHKMVFALHKIDPQNTEWKQRQLDKVDNAINELETIDDSTIREKSIVELRKQKKGINEAFRNNELDYGRKLYLIENCIYGVDIQPIATQISKLRFFISLIVDQKIDKSKQNFGIRPLPNLESKFVSANTLIGIDKPIMRELFDKQEIIELEYKLKIIRHKLFNIKSPSRKRILRENDKEIRNQIAELLIDNGLTNETAHQIAGWDPYNQNMSSSFFDSDWMFGINDGFDIVIGNPPYIKEYTDKSAFNGLRNSSYYQGKMDLWYFFGCKGIDFLKQGGSISYIAPNNWVTNEGASVFRNKVLKETAIRKFLDFRDFMIFESASIQTMVFVIEKTESEDFEVDYRKIDSEKSELKDIENLLIRGGKHIYSQVKFKPKEWFNKRLTFSFGVVDSILMKIEAKSNFKFKSTKEVATGIDVHQDFLNQKGADKLNLPKGLGVFNLTEEEKNSLELNSKELQLIKPFYTTEELYRYFFNKVNKLWVIYTDSSFKYSANIKPYPNIKRHLDRFQDAISSDNKPYGLHRARNENFFKGEKIISLRKCPHRPVFTYTDVDCYVSQTFFVIKTERINQKYLTALLNSELVAFWLRNKGKMQGKIYQVDKGPIMEIPIYEPSKEIQLVFSKIVDIVLWSSENEYQEYVYIFEKIIDGLIFELYFENHMKEKEIDIMRFVLVDIEMLYDIDQKVFISQLYSKWSPFDNEVRNRIQLFAERSPDILGQIVSS